MPKNTAALAIAAIVIMVILLMMCTYQVRFTQTAVVTRFDRIVDEIKPEEAGLHWKWPWPVERVRTFDARLKSFETEFRQQGTKDQRSIVLTVFATWRIDDARKFIEAVGPSEEAGAVKIEDRLNDVVNTVLKKHDLDELVNTDRTKTRFAAIEREFLEGIQEQIKQDYGIVVNSVGVKRLNLPQSVTQAVFARMKADRQKTIQELEAEGESRARQITSTAEQDANKILERARAYAKVIEARGEAEAAKYYKLFEENRELSDFLKKAESLLKIMRAGQTTVVIDAEEMSPFELLRPGDKSSMASNPDGERTADSSAVAGQNPSGADR